MGWSSLQDPVARSSGRMACTGLFLGWEEWSRGGHEEMEGMWDEGLKFNPGVIRRGCPAQRQGHTQVNR